METILFEDSIDKQLINYWNSIEVIGKTTNDVMFDFHMNKIP